MMFFAESISIMQTKDGRLLFFLYHNNTHDHLKIFSIDLCVNIFILFFFILLFSFLNKRKMTKFECLHYLTSHRKSLEKKNIGWTVNTNDRCHLVDYVD
jgi:hypothetical protein